jgi:hypothetical protein
MRFSTSGQVVFRQILQPTSGYQMLNAPSLAVRDDGTSTLAIFEGYATDGGGSVAAQTFMRFDGAGAVVFQSIPSTASPFVGPGDDLLTDPSGGFWALGGSGDGVNAPYVMSLLYHLTATGSVTWTQSYDSSWLDPLFAAGSGRAYLLHTAASSSAVAPTETIVSYPPDGTSSWTQVSQAPSSVAGMIADQMVIDARGNAIVGVSFPSSMVTAADGAVTTTPSAIGFQSFDATGHLRSTRTWDPQVISPPSVQEAPVHFGAIGVDPSGNVLLAATAGQDQETFTILLAKLAQ